MQGFECDMSDHMSAHWINELKLGECGVIDRFGRGNRGAGRNSRVNGCKLLASRRLGIIKNSLLVLNEVHLTFDIIFSIASVPKNL